MAVIASESSCFLSRLPPGKTWTSRLSGFVRGMRNYQRTCTPPKCRACGLRWTRRISFREFTMMTLADGRGTWLCAKDVEVDAIERNAARLEGLAVGTTERWQRGICRITGIRAADRISYMWFGRVIIRQPGSLSSLVWPVEAVCISDSTLIAEAGRGASRPPHNETRGQLGGA